MYKFSATFLVTHPSFFYKKINFTLFLHSYFIYPWNLIGEMVLYAILLLECSLLWATFTLHLTL